MLLKLAAFFAVAVSTRTQLPDGGMQWIYKSGPNKGYTCGLVKRDGAQFDVFLAAFPTNISATTPNLVQIPTQHFATRATAVAAVDQACPVK